MTSHSRSWAWPFVISISLTVGGICYVTLTYLLHASIIPCTAPWSTNLVLSLTAVLVLQAILSRKILPNQYKAFIAVHALLIPFALWLGLYSISPLGYSTGRIQDLRGFLVIRTNRNVSIENNEMVSLSQGSVVAIQPVMLSGSFDCTWTSAKGGQLDLPSTCDIVYVPPNAEYDILRLRIRSSCGLPDATGQIKVSILP